MTARVAIRGPLARQLGRTQSRIENQSAAMAQQLERFLQRLARFEARQEIARFLDSPLVGVSFQKAETTRADLEAQLARILQGNARTAYTRSTRRTLGSRTAEVTDQSMQAFMSSKDIRLQQIMSTSRRDVKESVRQIILTAMREDPRPSAGEIARRIRTVYHGDVGGRVEDVVPAPLINSRVLPTQRVRLDTGGNLYVFSSERAALIARTEMAQAENAGIIEGYTQAGVEGLKWLAYRDGRSGDRRHNEMHGVIVRVGEMFELPDGTRMPYPGYYGAPIKHLANCRCTTAPVIVMR